MLIEPQFFPPIQYLTKFLRNESIVFDDLSPFVKQTYRNRAYIVSANKIQRLTVPVKQGKTRVPFKEVKVDYSKNWPREIWMAIRSAYGKTPFFDFYGPGMEKLLKTRFTFLLDLDLATIRESLKILGLTEDFTLLSEFDENQAELSDWSSVITPKNTFKNDPTFYPAPYIQAFRERFGFIPNLSVLDLIFNEGPEGKSVLKSSLIQKG